MKKRVGDLELDEDIRFQRREWSVQQVGWWVLSVFVLAAFLGVFGGGPLSRARAGEPGEALWIEYERFARVGAATRISVHFLAGSENEPREVRLNREYFDALRLQGIVPEPAQVVVGQDAVTFRFAAGKGPGAETVVFDVEPTSPGPHRIRIRTGGARDLAFSQLVYF
jgi:hypothetical protein